MCLSTSVARSSPELGFGHVTLTTHAPPSPPLARHPSHAASASAVGVVWCVTRVLLQDGRTAVLIAAQNGHTTALEVLIRAGGDVNAATTVRRVREGQGRVVGYGSEMSMRAWRKGGVEAARERSRTRCW